MLDRLKDFSFAYSIKSNNKIYYLRHKIYYIRSILHKIYITLDLYYIRSLVNKSDLNFRTPFERIVRSREVAEVFISTELPGYIIRPVPGDEYCITHAFQENLNSIGRNVTFEGLIPCLRSELQSGKYESFKVDNANFASIFAHYDSTIIDLFLDVLAVVYKVNIKIIHNDYNTCYFLDQWVKYVQRNDILG